ncbi:hypothetical protein HK100_004319, partial [Physocladia obscura]
PQEISCRWPETPQLPGSMIFLDGLQINPPYQNKYPFVLVVSDQGSTFNWHAYSEHKDGFLVNAMRLIESITEYHALTVKIARLDPGELGTSHFFNEYCLYKHIHLEPGPRKTPSQDGGGERPLQTLVNLTRALCIQGKCPWNR